MATFLGSDTFCLDDLPLIDYQVTDPSVLIGQRLARRLQTPRGALGLISDDPNGGFDVRQYVNARLSPGEIAAAQSTITAECLKDEEVQNVKVDMSNSNGNLLINISAIAASGPFNLTLNVSDLTVQAVFSFGNNQGL